MYCDTHKSKVVYIICCVPASVAQFDVCLIGDQEVTGSISAGSSNILYRDPGVKKIAVFLLTC